MVLYALLLTGAIALFREQLVLWEEPLASQGEWVRSPISIEEMLERTEAALGVLPEELWLHLPKDGRGAPRVGYAASDGEWRIDWLGSDGLVAKREGLSDFLTALHYLWHPATGRWLFTLAGLLGLGLAVALVSGVLIHLKDLLRRWKIRRERLWSDIHVVIGVLTTPFLLLFALTGAFIILAPLSMPLFVGPVFSGDEARASRAQWGGGEGALLAAPLGAAQPLDPLFAKACAELPGVEITEVVLRRHGREDGVLEVMGRDDGFPNRRRSAKVSERTGALLHVEKTEDTGARFRSWIYGLHMVWFGGMGVRLLFFVLTLASCLVMLAGNVVWLERRRQRRGGAEWVVERLTAGVGSGLLVAIAALFAASRLLPFEMEKRTTFEEGIFLLTLVLCMGWAFAARRPATVSLRQLMLAGLLFAAVPFLALRSFDHGLLGASPVREAAAVELVLFSLGAFLVAASWNVEALRARHLPSARVVVASARGARAFDWAELGSLSSALVGAAPLALFSGVALARRLPLEELARFWIGYCAVIPLWLTAAMAVLALRSPGRRALVLGVGAALAALVVFI